MNIKKALRKKFIFIFLYLKYVIKIKYTEFNLIFINNNFLRKKVFKIINFCKIKVNKSIQHIKTLNKIPNINNKTTNLTIINKIIKIPKINKKN